MKVESREGVYFCLEWPKYGQNDIPPQICTLVKVWKAHPKHFLATCPEVQTGVIVEAEAPVRSHQKKNYLFLWKERKMNRIRVINVLSTFENKSLKTAGE